MSLDSIKTSLSAVRAILLSSCFILPGSLGAQSPASDLGNPSIVGAWQITFLSPTGSFQPIPGVMTFTSDYTVVESDAGEVVPTMIPGSQTQYGTTGQGAWTLNSDGEVSFKLIEVFGYPNDTLSVTGTVQFKVKLNPDGKNFFGSGNFEFVDRSGVVVATGTENLQGKRIRAD